MGCFDILFLIDSLIFSGQATKPRHRSGRKHKKHVTQPTQAQIDAKGIMFILSRVPISHYFSQKVQGWAAKEVEEVKHEDHKAAGDTSTHAEGAHAEEVKIEDQKVVVEAAPAVAPAHKAAH